MPAFVNLDEAQTIFFERELEHRKAQTYDVVRAPLKAMELIPVSTDAGAGAESIVYEQYDITGMAKVIANYADDLPRADVKAREFTARIRSIGNSYGYSIQEIRAAQMAGKALEQRKASAAARSQRESWNRIAWFGDADHGLQGWLDNANVPRAAVEDDGAGGGGGSTLWINKTPAQILRDMNDLANGIVSLTNGAEVPDTLVLPIEQYTLIATTPRSDNSDTTILEYFLRNSPYINSVEWANELKNAGTANSDIMIAYRRSPDALTLEMPVMFEQFPVQERGLEFVVPCHSRIGGVLIYYPLSQSIGEGI
ncbi:DUF2184 domain-containing protein [Marinibaculum pumilum]|uniref:DUF2184 domain-containing protein n=1 Tax=Marinibaculum pumilum TaxID=1766165 RepID=A0ABV7KY68_9PROT